MTSHNKLPAFLSILALGLAMGLSGTASAQTYGEATASKFTEWCTTTQGQPATVCSCALSKAAIEIPAATMSSFLAAPEGGAMATVGAGVGATALQIVATCAATASSPSTTSGGGLMNSLGSFGR